LSYHFTVNLGLGKIIYEDELFDAKKEVVN